MDLPIVLPFNASVGGAQYSFKDIRSLTPDEQVLVASLRGKFITKSVPQELLCASPSGQNRRRREIRARHLSEVDEAEELQKEDQRDTVRSTVEEVRGEREPLGFEVRHNGNLFGSFEWYSIKVIDQNPGRVRIAAGWFPAFVDTVGQVPAARISIGMVGVFLRRRFDMADGRKLDFVRAQGPLLDIPGRPDTDIIREALAEMARQGFTVDVTDDPRQVGRSRVRITI